MTVLASIAVALGIAALCVASFRLGMLWAWFAGVSEGNDG